VNITIEHIKKKANNEDGNNNAHIAVSIKGVEKEGSLSGMYTAGLTEDFIFMTISGDSGFDMIDKKEIGINI